MAFVAAKQNRWSKVGLRIGVGSVVAVLVLIGVDGLLRGPLALGLRDYTQAAMWTTWFTELRYMFEQLIYVGAIVFVGGKFIETRSIFTVGFDRLDADRVRIKGPDEENFVWIGHRYDSALEAGAVVDAMLARLAGDQEK